MHPFIKEIEAQIQLYERNKGSGRKFSMSLFGESAFFGHSFYMDNLITAFNAIKNKEVLTMYDLQWFIEKHIISITTWDLWGYSTREYSDSNRLSARIFNNVKAAMERHFPHIEQDYRQAKDNICKVAEENFAIECTKWDEEASAEYHGHLDWKMTKRYTEKEELRKIMMVSEAAQLNAQWGVANNQTKKELKPVNQYKPHNKL